MQAIWNSLSKVGKLKKSTKDIEKTDTGKKAVKESGERVKIKENGVKKKEEVAGNVHKDGVVSKGGSKISRPTWRQSELDAAVDFPNYDAQKSFLKGEEVPYGTKGSVRPDYYKDGYSVDIKNYNVESASGRNTI